MAPKHAKLQILFQQTFICKTFAVGIKTKNLPRTSRFGLWSFYQEFYKATTCRRQPLFWEVPIMVALYRFDCIYINSNLNPLTKFTSSNRSTEFKDILSWNISQMITKTIPISMKRVMSYAMKWGIPLWVWWKANGNWDNNMLRISQWRERYCRTDSY